jgi:hypothetical protein
MPANDLSRRGHPEPGTLSPESTCCAPSPTCRGRNVSLTRRMRSTEARFALLYAAIGLPDQVEACERGVKQLTKPGNLVAPQPSSTVVTLKD